MNLGNFDVGDIFKAVERKAPTIGTLYGVFAPLAATGKAVGDQPLSAIIRELTAVIKNPRVPNMQESIDWFNAYSLETAKFGALAWVIGELLSNSNISKFGVNALKGTALATLIGVVGGGGGAPYGNIPQTAFANRRPALSYPSISWGYKT